MKARHAVHNTHTAENEIFGSDGVATSFRQSLWNPANHGVDSANTKVTAVVTCCFGGCASMVKKGSTVAYTAAHLLAKVTSHLVSLTYCNAAILASQQHAAAMHASVISGSVAEWKE